MNTVIVIGNGFDIDLGWHTSYKDFFLTRYGHKQVSSNDDTLLQYMINHANNKKNWYDLEKMLYDYSLVKSKVILSEQQLRDDIADYQELKTQLVKFIKEQSSKPVNKDSYAYRLLKKYMEVCKANRLSPDLIPKLFSFNYTDLKGVAKLIDPKSDFLYEAVHGTLSDNNIIFGFHNDVAIKGDYRSFQKSFDDAYESHNILPALIDATNIVFFGMSMGYIDAPYYEEVLKQTSTVGGYNSRMHKNITFITYDKESKLNIKNNLLDIGIDTQVLSNTNSVKFFLTSEKGNKVFDTILNTI